MGKTIYYVASSLDGFIADAEDGLDWLMQFGFEEFQATYDQFIRNIGAIVMGSGTYEFILREGPHAWSYTVPAWVMTSRELPAIPGKDITFSSKEVRSLHRDLSAAAGDKNIWIVGGGGLVAQFIEHGLVDEMRVTYMPAALGSGKPLLPVAATTRPFQLIDTQRFQSGAIELRYSLH